MPRLMPRASSPPIEFISTRQPDIDGPIFSDGSSPAWRGKGNDFSLTIFSSNCPLNPPRGMRVLSRVYRTRDGNEKKNVISATS